MKRVLLDQGLPAIAVIFLREDGWDAVHVRETGMRDATDAEILAYAARESRVAITLDRDFPQILALLGAVRPSVGSIPKTGRRLYMPTGFVVSGFHQR